MKRKAMVVNVACPAYRHLNSIKVHTHAHKYSALQIDQRGWVEQLLANNSQTQV